MTLFHGDCLEKLKEIETGSVDMVLADLPYGTTACKWDSVIPFASLWVQFNRITKENAALVMFGAEPFSSALRMSALKFFKYDWIWEKNRPTGHLNAKKQPMRKTEVISVFYRKQPVYNPQGLRRGVFNNTRPCKARKAEGDHPHGNERSDFGPSEFAGYPHNLLSFPTEHNTKTDHPTQKPVALLEYLIKTYTNEGDTVLDPTMGSGSTGVACKNLNRKFIGIEKEPKYFEIAQKRIFDTFPEFKKQTFPDPAAAGADVAADAKSQET